VENTRNFAQNASADQLLPQLQMVVQELKTKFGTWEIWGDINRFKDCQEILILTMMILLLVCLSAASLWGCFTLQSVYQESQRKGMVTVVIVCMCSRDKVKAKSLLAGEIVVILNQNILMINRKCIKRAKTCFLQRRCRKTERTKVPSWRINTRDRN
jgi:hypothetical protein